VSIGVAPAERKLGETKMGESAVRLIQDWGRLVEDSLELRGRCRVIAARKKAWPRK
jgi:hypothetical protein